MPKKPPPAPRTLSPDRQQVLLEVLEARFAAAPARHPRLSFAKVRERLVAGGGVLSTLDWMEATGGEPDVVDLGGAAGRYVFCDCSPESPKGRRSLCYDQAALAARKEHPPAGSAWGLAEEKGAALLDEEQYGRLQRFGPFDTKTSSWLATPGEIRALGGALFGDHRFGRVFTYHNGAESYYAARGFRAFVAV